MPLPIAAVIQMTSTADVEKNLVQAEEGIAQAASHGARLVVLPEAFAHLGPEHAKLAVAEPLPQGGPILRRCAEMARAYSVELVLGGFWEAIPSDDQRVYNTSVVLDAGGRITAMYRKIHLFDVTLPDGTDLQESATVKAGEQTVVAPTALGATGLSICYDLRFPELYRKLVHAGAQVLTVPAAFTSATGPHHWHVLLRARAIESQCFVLAAAQTGHHHGRRYSYGHSIIVDPWGRVLAECGDQPGIAWAEIDLEHLERVRVQLPSLQHRRIQ